jgi:hypothetical protein
VRQRIIAISSVGEGKSPSINYEDEAKRDSVNQTMDALKRKYGEEVVQRGVTFLVERDRVAVNPFEKKNEILE